MTKNGINAYGNLLAAPGRKDQSLFVIKQTITLQSVKDKAHIIDMAHISTLI